MTSRHRLSLSVFISLAGCGGDPNATTGTTTEAATTTGSVTTEPSTTELSWTTDPTSEATSASTTDLSSTGTSATTGSTTTDITTTEALTTTDITTTGAVDPTCGDGAIDRGETCDDGPANGPGQPCNATCAPNTCGDGDKGPDEACDDGNDIDTDDCTTACLAAACGDDLVGPTEQCDDGNLQGGDGCSASCEVEPAKALGKLFLTSANGEPGFHGYTIASDTWATLASPPDVTCTQITNDGESVYLIGLDNTIYQYDIDADTWSPSPVPGPGEGLVTEPIGYFKWTDQGFYYLHDYEKTLYRYKDDMWYSTALEARGASAGSWDRAKNELYIRTWAEMGFQVVHVGTDELVRTISDATQVVESSRFGSLSGAFFYTRTFTGTVQKLDAITGVKTDTGLLPTAHHNSSDTDVTTGLIYLGGYDDSPSVFQVYDPADNTLTVLSPSPPVSNHSSITVMIAP